MNAEKKRNERETRCYALTGAAQMLDTAERILQTLERTDEAKEPRLLLVALEDGIGGVTLRTLATWIEEE